LRRTFLALVYKHANATHGLDKMQRASRKLVLYSPFLKTNMFQADIPDDKQAFAIKVSRDYMHVDDNDLDAFKKLITLHSGVPAGTALRGRVGVDVIMLNDTAKRHIVCVDLRGVDYGHVQLYIFEKIGDGIPDIDLSILRTFEMIDSVMHHVQDAPPTQSVVMRSGRSDTTCPGVVDYAGPTGRMFDLREYTMDKCSNCSCNHEHLVYGQKKLSD